MVKTILDETLQDFNYYLNKLPLYLKNDTAFHSHFRIWYDLLVPTSVQDDTGLAIKSDAVVGVADALFCLLTIFDDNYLQTYIDENSTVSNVLDILGKLFGVTRTFTVDYFYKTEQTANLTLTNKLFLYLIKGQIIKNYCDGTYDQIKEYYRSIGLDIAIVVNGSASVMLYKNTANTDELDDFDILFLSGLLTIKSIGIIYSYTVVSFNLILTWSADNNGTAYRPTSQSVKSTECWYRRAADIDASIGGYWV